MSTAFAPMSSPRAREVKTLSGEELRRAFLIGNVILESRIKMTFTDLDRMALGGVKPTAGPVTLDNDRETGADFFLARRELGVINVGGPGKINVDGKSFSLANLDCL